MRVDVAIRNSKHVFKGLRRVKDGVTVPTFSIKSQHRLGYTIWQVSFEYWISWSCISFFLTPWWSYQQSWQHKSPQLPYSLPWTPSGRTFSLYPHMSTSSLIFLPPASCVSACVGVLRRTNLCGWKHFFLHCCWWAFHHFRSADSKEQFAHPNTES